METQSNNLVSKSESDNYSEDDEVEESKSNKRRSKSETEIKQIKKKRTMKKQAVTTDDITSESDNMEIEEEEEEDIEDEVEEEEEEENENEKEDEKDKEADEAAENIKEEQMEVNTGNLKDIQRRIRDVIMILSDFKRLREGNKSRNEYMEVLQQDLCMYYSYNNFLMEKLMQMFPLDELLEFLEASEVQRPMTIRTNTLRTRRRDLAEVGFSLSMLN